MPSQQPNQPQLVMFFTQFDALPEIKLPEGYSLWTLQERDEDEWMEALNATGQLGKWGPEQIRKWLDGERHAVKEGTFLIIFDGKPVATACTVPPRSTEPRTEIGWVSVSPEHQGKSLGYLVTLAVLHYIKQTGATEAVLHTDDWRLPAIKSYLNLGFEPDINHDSYPVRWNAVYETLGLGRRLQQ